MCFFKKKKKEETKANKTEEKLEKDTVKKENTEVKEDSKEEKGVEKENSEKSKKGVYRVVFDKEDKLWKIKKDGAKRVIDSRKTKEEALARVQELSESQDTKFVVYKKDDKFQKKANLNLKNNNNH